MRSISGCQPRPLGKSLLLEFKEGFARGTWFKEEDESAERGGRLYQTAMNAAALEVYYRYLPVYQQKNVFDSWDKKGD